MLAAICASIALAIAAAPPHAKRLVRPPVARKAAPRPAGSLDKARAQLADVKRDPAKRRYRHRWERAIKALEKAARGRDTAPALLDAARARYALYRFSQVDSDRDAALALAARAQRAGARDAAVFARAVRREMGDEESPVLRAPAKRRPARSAQAAAPPKAPAPASTKSAAAPNVPAAPPAPPPLDEEPPMDAILEQVLANTEDGKTAAAPKAPASVSEVKAWSNHDYTRVAVYLSKPVSFTREEIPGDAEHPRRVALDLKPAVVAQGLAHDVGDALVKRVSATQHEADTVRVVLDLPGRDDLTIFALEDPPRLIVDVGAPPSPEPQPEGRASASPSTAEDGALGPQRPIRRIIVDAGHGGHDTGAVGPSRIREKDVTLAMARRLARRLQSRGFEVVLTRDDDRFVALEGRTAMANARHGDLFVSLHANAHPRRDRGGVETYVLNVADDRYAARLAARENGALSDGAADIPILRRILSDLEAKSSVEASRRLATVVQRELCTGIRSRIGDVRDLGVKSALFYVLLGARMPAVLVETSFISNRVEEKRLSSARFQDEVASAIARAVERFASREARVASAR